MQGGHAVRIPHRLMLLRDMSMKRFQDRSPGWPGLTNGKARTGDRRAIRFAPDPATRGNS